MQSRVRVIALARMWLFKLGLTCREGVAWLPSRSASKLVGFSEENERIAHDESRWYPI